MLWSHPLLLMFGFTKWLCYFIHLAMKAWKSIMVFNSHYSWIVSPQVVSTLLTAEILAKNYSFAVGEVNETYERFLFNKMHQTEGESFESFLAAICSLMKTCNYHKDSQDSILRDRIVLGIREQETQKLLLYTRGQTNARSVWTFARQLRMPTYKERYWGQTQGLFRRLRKSVGHDNDQLRSRRHGKLPLI